jgi:methylated-DNA-[protein]-cysteine S-methyltransferase
MRTAIDSRIKKGLAAEFKEERSEVVDKTIEQLAQYFEKERTEFDIPLLLVGTDFQESVWKQLQQIPYGVTNSYLELSRKMDNEKAIRAVATANGANAISILIPCHRIIGKGGSLVGYAGGLATKEKLLELEGAIVNNQLMLF